MAHSRLDRNPDGDGPSLCGVGRLRVVVGAHGHQPCQAAFVERMAPNQRLAKKDFIDLWLLPRPCPPAASGVFVCGFASVAVSGGFSLPLIGKLLSHKKAAATERYTHLADDPVRAANKEIAQLMVKSFGPRATAE